MDFFKHPLVIFIAGVLVGTYAGAKIKSAAGSAASKLA